MRQQTVTPLIQGLDLSNENGLELQSVGYSDYITDDANMDHYENPNFDLRTNEKHRKYIKPIKSGYLGGNNIVFNNNDCSTANAGGSSASASSSAASHKQMLLKSMHSENCYSEPIVLPPPPPPPTSNNYSFNNFERPKYTNYQQQTSNASFNKDARERDFDSELEHKIEKEVENCNIFPKHGYNSLSAYDRHYYLRNQACSNEELRRNGTLGKFPNGGQILSSQNSRHHYHAHYTPQQEPLQHMYLQQQNRRHNSKQTPSSQQPQQQKQEIHHNQLQNQKNSQTKNVLEGALISKSRNLDNTQLLHHAAYVDNIQNTEIGGSGSSSDSHESCEQITTTDQNISILKSLNSNSHKLQSQFSQSQFQQIQENNQQSQKIHQKTENGKLHNTNNLITNNFQNDTNSTSCNSSSSSASISCSLNSSSNGTPKSNGRGNNAMLVADAGFARFRAIDNCQLRNEVNTVDTET